MTKRETGRRSAKRRPGQRTAPQSESVNTTAREENPHINSCAACGRPIAGADRGWRRHYCSRECKRRPAPAVFRFVCPDGRSYIGCVADVRERSKHGPTYATAQITDALRQYPPKQWTFEVLERLPPGCSRQTMLAAKRRHIARLRTWSLEGGFN
jgi:hypothetical protein